MVDFDKYHTERVEHFTSTGGSAANGLTIRDYFAARAMQEIVRSMYDEGLYIGDRPNYPLVRLGAVSAYKMADEMMKARNETT